MINALQIMELTWNLFRKNMRLLLPLALLMSIVSVGSQYLIDFFSNPEKSISRSMLFIAAGLGIAILLLTTLIQTAFILQIAKLLNNETASLVEFFKNALQKFLRVISVQLLIMLISIFTALPYLAPLIYDFATRGEPTLASGRLEWYILASPLLLIPTYFFLRLVSSVLEVILDNVSVLHALKNAWRNGSRKFWHSTTRLILPQFGWELIQSLILFVLMLIAFIGGAFILGTQTLGNNSYLTKIIPFLILVGRVLIETFFIPLTTCSFVIWYGEYKKLMSEPHV